MKAWPARSDRASRSMASGNCSSNDRTRRVALNWTTATGAKAASPPTKSARNQNRVPYQTTA